MDIHSVRSTQPSCHIFHLLISTERVITKASKSHGYDLTNIAFIGSISVAA
jgi:hypothetical protein